MRNQVQRKLVSRLISGQSPICKVRMRSGKGAGRGSVLIIILSCYKLLILHFRNWRSPAYSHLYLYQRPIFLQGHPRLNFPSSSCVPLPRSHSQAHREPGAFSGPAHHLPPSHHENTCWILASQVDSPDQLGMRLRSTHRPPGSTTDMWLQIISLYLYLELHRLLWHLTVQFISLKSDH